MKEVHGQGCWRQKAYVLKIDSNTHTHTYTSVTVVSWSESGQTADYLILPISKPIAVIQMHETHVDVRFLILLLYLHEQRGLHGMKQTNPQMLVFILHCYHIKADNFRHSQQDRNNPNQNDFGGCPSWKPGAFDLIPGYDSPVSVKINGTMLRLRGLFVCKNDTFIHWFQHISRAYAKQFYLLDKIQTLYRACILVQHTRECRLFLHLSTLKAHKLSTVIPTDVFWRKGTSLHSSTPNGQSSAMSWNRKKSQLFPVRKTERCGALIWYCNCPWWMNSPYMH